MTAERSHWLAKIAQDAGLERSGELQLPFDASVSEAWPAILRVTRTPSERLAELVAERFRLEVADLATADPRAIRLVPESLATQFQVFPVREDYRRLIVATADPTQMAAEQALQFASGRAVQFQVAPPAAVEEAILFHYAPDKAAARFMEQVPAPAYDPSPELDLEGSIRMVEDTTGADLPTEEVVGSGPVVRLTNMIFQEAIRLGASDIHLQPTPRGGVIRYRVDGVLRTAGTLPLTALGRIISRVKIMGRLDISDRLRPQDGRARVTTKNRNVDLRISTVPTRNAEKAVIRLLDPGSSKGLGEVGFPPEELARFQSLLTNRDGIVVVTGPTGSGKTTTMYAALQSVSGDDVNVMTVEDPVEFELPGTTQIQVETRQGVTFASALRAILRQDPDVIFVGEIRDSETAQVAVQAAMTGHLVLATLHTNDAVGSIRRLTDLGLDAPAINESFRGAVAQRLVRRPCPECRQEVTEGLSQQEVELARRYRVKPRYRPIGCERCGQTGYKGRVPVIQIMIMTSELRTLVDRGGTPDEFEAAARKAGMKSLAEAGAAKVATGETTLQELDRVLGETGTSPEEEEPTPHPPIAISGTAVQDAAGVSPESRRARVLVVDDDRTVRTVGRALLESEGHEVLEAEDGQAGLDLLQSTGLVDLIILDLSMPVMGGEDFLRQIRGTVATVGIPVMVLTSDTDPDSEVRLVDAGADDYIRKPFDPRLFVSRTRAALRRVRG